MSTLRTTVIKIKFNPFKFVYSVGVIALITSISVKVNAFESSKLLTAQRIAQPPFTEAASQQEPDKTDASNIQRNNSTSRSTDEKPKRPSSNFQEDETVSVDDIPLECHSYFLGKNSFIAILNEL